MPHFLSSVYKVANKFKENPNFTMEIAAAFVFEFVRNSWIFTNMPMAGADENEPGKKTALFIFSTLFTVGLFGFIGRAVDQIKTERNEFDVSSHRGAITAGGLAVAKTITDNFWIFTDVPLPGEETSHPAAKLFYLLALMIVQCIMFGVIGHGYDKSRDNQNERQRLIT